MSNRAKIAKLVNMSLAFHNLNKTAEVQLGLSLVQFHLLACIKDLPASSPQEIAKLAGIHPSSLTQSMKRLEKRGLLYIGEDPRDSRKKILSLTLKGKSALDAFDLGIEEILELPQSKDFQLSKHCNWSRHFI